MGNAICGKSSTISNPEKKNNSKSSNPKQAASRFSKQKSNFALRAAHADHKKHRVSLGKSLSFHHISVEKLLHPQGLPHEKLVKGLNPSGLPPIRHSLKSMSLIFAGEDLLKEISQEYPEISNVSVKKIQGNGALLEYQSQGAAKMLLKRKGFKNIESFSQFLIHLQNITKHNVPGIEKFKDLVLNQKENEYFLVDIFKEKIGEGLMDFYEKKQNANVNYLEILDIIKKISIILHRLHRKNVAFKTLKPSTILIDDSNSEDIKVFLAIGGSHSSTNEDNFVEFYVKTEEDYKSFDLISLAFVFVTLFSREVSMEDLYKVRSNKDIDRIFSEKCKEVPRLILDFMKKMLDIESKNHYLKAGQLISEAESLFSKGLQNEFQQDFLAEVFKKKAVLTNKAENYQETLFFHHKNKIFFYDEAKEITYIVKVFLGTRKWKLRNGCSLCYSKQMKAFFVLAEMNKGKIAKILFDPTEIPLNQGAKVAEVRRNIEFFQEIEQGLTRKYEVLCKETGNLLVVGERVYEISNDCNEEILCEDDKIKQLKGFHYSFLDQRQENLYILKESADIFGGGLTLLQICAKKSEILKEVREIHLNFHVNNKSLLESFKDLSLGFHEVFFCIELTDSIFLLNAGKILLIIDLNKAVFYSFSSLFQLQNYEYAKYLKLTSFSHMFEVRNLPFPLDLSKGRFFFEEGILQLLCKKDADLLLCKFVLIPNQSCISLLKCKDLATGHDLMIYKPKEIKLHWNIIQPKVEKTTVFNLDLLAEIGKYSLLSMISRQGDGELEFKCQYEKEFFSLKKLEIASIKEFEKIQKNFFFILENSYLIEMKEVFLHEENGRFFAIIIREYYESTLLQEFLHRKTKQKYFSSKNLAFLLKCLLKGVIFLGMKGVEHGNIDLSNVVFTDKGFVKIKGWYLENKQTFTSDLFDVGMLILECATLEILYEFSEENLEKSKDFLEINYPGLYNFLSFLLKNKGKENQELSLKQLEKELGKTYYRMQYKDLDIGKYQTEKQKMFWINYGDNSIISADITTQKHQVHRIVDEKLQPYILSTSNCLTFDNNEHLYLTGNQRFLKEFSYKLLL